MTGKNSQAVNNGMLASNREAHGGTTPAASTLDGAADRSKSTIQVALLTGGGDKPYALGLAGALAAMGVAQDFIGSNDLDVPEIRNAPGLRFLNLRGDQSPNSPGTAKFARVLRYYCRLIGYAATARPKLFHLLWNNKFEWFDRTLLMLFYRLLGKRVVFTAHNVNVGKRDDNDSWLNRLTLRIQYQLCDQIFVHTERMKAELLEDFGLPADRATVIPFGINNTIPDTGLSGAEARSRFGLRPEEKCILFFGNIAPYKGLNYLVEAMGRLPQKAQGYRLIIAGRPKGAENHWKGIQEMICASGLSDRVIERIEYIPDDQIEVLFKAADVLVLPYTQIFQSGVLFLGYNFGLPVIATDVGSMKDDIVLGKTGYLCAACDAAQLASTIECYFSSDMFRDLERQKREIRDFARRHNSWITVGEKTRDVYRAVIHT